MTRNVRSDPKARGCWVDADSGLAMPKGWNIARLPNGGTYTFQDGIIHTVKDVHLDPRTGGVVVVASWQAPPTPPGQNGARRIIVPGLRG